VARTRGVEQGRANRAGPADHAGNDCDFSDAFLASQVALRGGTVLHKVHLAPASRYSEDIDLVLVGERPIGHIQKALVRVLQPLLGQPTLSVLDTIQLAVRNVVRPSKVARMLFAYQPTIRPPARMIIKIEVNYSEREPFFEIVDLLFQPPLPDLTAPVALRSYDLDEMLGTKMRALLQRTQGRDLYDLDLALSHRAGSDPQRVVLAFGDYMRREGTRVTRVEFERALDRKVASRAFREDMNTMLPPGATFDAHRAAARIRTMLLSLLPP
jgi:predicted nucleotidyltransferase component of viral defense system